MDVFFVFMFFAFLLCLSSSMLRELVEFVERPAAKEILYRVEFVI